MLLHEQTKTFYFRSTIEYFFFSSGILFQKGWCSMQEQTNKDRQELPIQYPQWS